MSRLPFNIKEELLLANAINIYVGAFLALYHLTYIFFSIVKNSPTIILCEFYINIWYYFLSSPIIIVK